MQVLDPHRADAQGVDQRVARVGRVEDHLAADVGQARGSCRSRRRPATTPGSTRAVSGASAGPKRSGSATAIGRAPIAMMSRTMPADARGRALVGLDVGRVVVRLDLERHRPAVADLDHAGVLADPGEHPLLHRVRGRLAEVAQVHLRRLVGAVLAPHHRVHRQLGVGGPAAEDLPDPQVLVVLEPELAVGLGMVGGGGGGLDGVAVAVGGAGVTGDQPTYRRTGSVQVPPSPDGGARRHDDEHDDRGMPRVTLDTDVGGIAGGGQRLAHRRPGRRRSTPAGHTTVDTKSRRGHGDVQRIAGARPAQDGERQLVEGGAQAVLDHHGADPVRRPPDGRRGQAASSDDDAQRDRPRARPSGSSGRAERALRPARATRSRSASGRGSAAGWRRRRRPVLMTIRLMPAHPVPDRSRRRRRRSPRTWPR